MPYTEPLLAPAVEARIRELVRDELARIGLIVEINGTVQIDAETIGKCVFPTIQILVDESLAISLGTIGDPGSGAAAVGGTG